MRPGFRLIESELPVANGFVCAMGGEVGFVYFMKIVSVNQNYFPRACSAEQPHLLSLRAPS